VVILLGPRFKVKGFSSATFAEMAKSNVLKKKLLTHQLALLRNKIVKKELVEKSTLWEKFDTDCPVTLRERELKQ